MKNCISNNGALKKKLFQSTTIAKGWTSSNYWLRLELMLNLFMPYAHIPFEAKPNQDGKWRSFYEPEFIIHKRFFLRSLNIILIAGTAVHIFTLFWIGELGCLYHRPMFLQTQLSTVTTNSSGSFCAAEKFQKYIYFQMIADDKAQVHTRI